jgi:hypothetical protein
VGLEHEGVIEMIEIDQTYLEHELAYRAERLRGHRDDRHPHPEVRRRRRRGLLRRTNVAL